MSKELEEIEDSVIKVESLCPKCEKIGLTQILPTTIPFYKEILVTSFICPYCDYRNNEIMRAQEIKTYGIRYSLNIINKYDYDRMVVITDYTNICIPLLELNIPPMINRGEVTTIEGIFNKAYEELNNQYGEEGSIFKRHLVVIEKNNLEQLRSFLRNLKKIIESKPVSYIELQQLNLEGCTLPQSFEIILDDPSGNCFIENPKAPSSDPNLEITKYERTQEQNISLGFGDATEQETEVSKNSTKDIKEGHFADINDEVMQFPCQCPSCGNHTVTNMKLTKIPHFDEIILMATNCDKCGYKGTEVKPGGGIEGKGIRIELSVKDINDLKREIIKSETCSISIPQYDLELSPTTLGSKYTTVEGILLDIKNQLNDYNPFAFGDSSNSQTNERYKKLLENLDNMARAKIFNYTLILDDPAGKSHITKTEFCSDNKKYSEPNLTDPNVPEPIDNYIDPNVKYYHYERSWQQNEDLGLNDMKV